MISSYFLELRTGTDYPLDAYEAAAGRMAQMLVDLLSSVANLTSLTNESPRESCNSDIEVMLEDGGAGRELVAKVVVDIDSDEFVKFDKGKWSKLVKARPEVEEWPKLKINKRQVTD